MLYSFTQTALQYAVLGLFATAAASPLAPRQQSTNINLATNGQGVTAYYRIPALEVLGNNVVLASWDARPDNGDSPSPNSIIQRRSTDGGLTWGPVTYIAKGRPGATGVQKYGFSDPSYVVDRKTGKVFNFHVFSKNTGFGASVIGNDDTNLNVISAQVSVSTDGGLTWNTDPTRQPNLPPVASANGNTSPLITKVVKPVGSTVNGVANVGGVVGMFATSGAGIQLRYGAKAGRLVQQFAGSVIQPSGNTAIQAWSVYSDDGGATWQRGNFVGTGMDENKVVELSNGTLMMNSRDSGRSGYRKVSLSTDQGVNWSAPRIENQLIDPTNNAHITRAYPDAAQGSKEAKILLFTNSASQTSRSLGTVRFSCDDGNTWNAGKRFQSGYMAYSVIQPLGGDWFGIFYEGPNGVMAFARFDKAYIGINC
ncbi:glycoside hydrolase family 33 protein [Sporormia fimetaria CBS 119925]|uniref:Glycoside hydrolase family 33 protein n=1 Tax=Sporormia fimetaria CBS 119925 TaxID=1340428 RepID=A0A6A6VMN7_9PLEO|nr:glycoside hydrolase family 33 protein [Sporormia fimetaria CBS 119925]